MLGDRVEFSKENVKIATAIMLERGLINKNVLVVAVEMLENGKIRVITKRDKNKVLDKI